MRNRETPAPAGGAPGEISAGRARRPGPFRISSLIWSVYAPSFLLAIGTGFLFPILPGFASSLGAGMGLIGLAIAAVSIGNMVGDVPAGLLVDRMGRKRSMIFATAGMGLAAVGAGLSPNLPMFLAMRLIAGVFMAVWGISRHAYLADVVPNPQRGRALALFGGVSRIGTFLGPLAGGYIGQFAGLQWPFFAQAVLSGATVALILASVRDATERRRAHRPRPAYAALAGTLVRHRRSFLTAGPFSICLSFLRTGRQTLVPLSGEALGLSVGDIGLILSISSAIDMTLFMPAGFIMDRLGRKWASLPCILIMSAGLALIPFADGFITLMLAGLVLGFGNGLGSGIMLTLGADLAPEENTAEFLGMWRLISDSGRAIGPAAIGQIGQAAALTVAGLATAGVGVAGAAILIFLVPETLIRRPRRHRHL
ncbi:MAG: MFS transporter [Chloroflexi bacterium]|nr:MFS transporter [Chloroflexota bacterium]